MDGARLAALVLHLQLPHLRRPHASGNPHVVGTCLGSTGDYVLDTISCTNYKSPYAAGDLQEWQYYCCGILLQDDEAR
jgi:hypothetical protein